MRSIFEALTYSDITTRINRLEPGTKPLWGRMTTNEMICHVSDGLRDIMGIRTVKPMLLDNVVQQLKAVVFGEKEWDHNLQTFPPYSQDEDGGGTKPTHFKDDRATFLSLLNQFKNTPSDFTFHLHAGLNILSREEFGIYIWRHIDYHLRQFGV